MGTGNGNRGEWGEPYVALHLLGTGKLYMADADGVKNPNEYMNILDVLRQETMERLVIYHYNPETTMVSVKVNNLPVALLPASQFLAAANTLKNEVITSCGHAFSLSDDLMRFILYDAKMEHLKAKSIDKSDIFLNVSDPRTSIVREHIGFSIKTKFGHPPTLFNTAKSSATVYEVSGMTESLLQEINAMTDSKGHTAVIPRCQRLLDAGCKLTFVGFPIAQRAGCEAFRENLELINPQLVDVIERMLWYHFFEGNLDNDIEDVTKNLIRRNPCNLTRPDAKYPFMMKQFLYAAYCGLTASTLWNGKGQVNGGFITVTAEGEVLASYALESEEFKGYLYKHCFLDFPSTKENHGDYAKVYRVGGKYYFNLNFQIKYR